MKILRSASLRANFTGSCKKKSARGCLQLVFVPINGQLAARGKGESDYSYERDEIFRNDFLHSDKNYFQEILLQH